MRHIFARRRYPSVQRHFVSPIHIQHDVVIAGSATKERSHVAILEVGATNYRLKSREEQEAIIAAYHAFVRTLRFPLQILVSSGRMDLSPYIARLSTLSSSDPRWTRLVRSHQSELEELGARRTLIDRRFYLIIHARPGDTRSSGRGFLRSRHHRQTSEEFRQAQHLLQTRIGSLEQHLGAMGLFHRRLMGYELAEVHYRSVRGSDHVITYPLREQLVEAIEQLPANKRNIGAFPLSLQELMDHKGEAEEALSPDEARVAADFGLSLADLLAPECIIIEPDVVRVGEEYVRGIAVVGYPREVIEGWLSSLLHLDEICDQTFFLEPQENGQVLRELILRKAQYASTQRINQRQGRHLDPTITVAQGDIESLMGEIASGEESMLQLSWYLLLRAKSRDALDQSTDRVRNALSNLLVSAHPTTLEHDLAYKTIQPLGRDHLRRGTRLTSSIVSTMFPFVSDSLVMKEGVFVGVTPSGEPILLDPWALENPHEFWGGISGAGKSYAVKLRMLHELERDPHVQVIAVDPSREYHRLTEEVGGQVIRLAPGSAHCINPFDLVPPGTNMVAYVRGASADPLADKVQKLHALLDLMLADHIPVPTALSGSEKSHLDRAIYECYRKVGITSDVRTHDRPAPLLRDLYDVLRSAPDDVGEDSYGLADRLHRYVKGSLAGLFAKATNVSLDNRLITFDIREMSGFSELRPIGIFLITEFVWTQAISRPMPRRLYIDEAWSLIEHEHGARFVEKLAREARKYYLSLVTITQNPEQFIASNRGSVIAQNAFTKVLKRLDSVGSRAAREAFGLTEEEERLLLTLGQHQALLMCGSRRLVVEIHASEVEHELITTRPDELARHVQERLRNKETLQQISGTDNEISSLNHSNPLPQDQGHSRKELS